MSACRAAGHLLAVVYTRPWRRLFRKTYHLRCWFCDVEVVES